MRIWEMLLHVHPLLQPVVIPRNVAFMREIQFVVRTRDHAFLPNCVLGNNMLGWAQKAPSQVVRISEPEVPIDHLWHDVDADNAKVLQKISSSGDEALDVAAWQKTHEEIQLGVVQGPFTSLEELPFF